jgi:RNA polymerase sigma-70 factor (ECF subfamily)
MQMLSILLAIENEDERNLAKQLYITYKNKMYGIAYAILHNRCDAEDAVMDSVYKIVNNISKFSDTDRNKNESLIVIIVRNTAINSYNLNKRHATVLIDDTDDNLPSIEPTPEEMFVQAESHTQLIQTIKQLDPIYRDVILMKYLYGYDNTAIASLTGIGETTVRVRLMRSKSLLASFLKGGVPDEN